MYAGCATASVCSYHKQSILDNFTYYDHHLCSTLGQYYMAFSEEPKNSDGKTYNTSVAGARRTPVPWAERMRMEDIHKHLLGPDVHMDCVVPVLVDGCMCM